MRMTHTTTYRVALIQTKKRTEDVLRGMATKDGDSTQHMAACKAANNEHLLKITPRLEDVEQETTTLKKIHGSSDGIDDGGESNATTTCDGGKDEYREDDSRTVEKKGISSEKKKRRASKLVAASGTTEKCNEEGSPQKKARKRAPAKGKTKKRTVKASASSKRDTKKRSTGLSKDMDKSAELTLTSISIGLVSESDHVADRSSAKKKKMSDVSMLRKQVPPRHHHGQDMRENGDAAAVETSKTKSTILLLRCTPPKNRLHPDNGYLKHSLPEIQSIEKAWAGKRIGESAVDVKTLKAGNATDLIKAMMTTNLRILHITAHLDFELFGGESILFVDKDAKLSSVPAKNLVSLLKTSKETLDLIVLNGCNSDNTAWRLVDECGVKAVIGWSTAVDDEAARIFGVALHRAMAEGHDPFKAFEKAKEAVKNHPDEEIAGFDHGVHRFVKPNKFVLMDPLSNAIELFDQNNMLYAGRRIQKPKTSDVAFRIPAGIPIFYSRAYDGHRKCAPPRLDKADFVDGLRSEDVEKVKTLILESSKGEQVTRDTSAATESNEAVRTRQKIGVHGVNGLGGLGKTVLAKQLCSLKQIRQHFNRGDMYWLTASNENPLEELQKLVHDLVKMHAPDADLQEKLENKETVLERAFELFKRVDAPVLIVLDDVWKANRVKQLVPMDALPKGSVVLMTYRKQSVGEIVGAKPYALKKLSKRSAMALFEDKSGVQSIDGEVRSIIELLVKRLGYHPMAIAIVGRLARRRLRGINSPDMKVIHSTLRNIREKLKDGFVDDDDDDDSAGKMDIDGETWVRAWISSLKLDKKVADKIIEAGFDSKELVLDMMTADSLKEDCEGLPPIHRRALLQGLKKLRDEETKRRHTCVRYCIGESVKDLKEAERECFMEFAIFPEDTSIPYGVLERIMPANTKKRLDALVDATLVERSASSTGLIFYQLHDLCRDYVRGATKDKLGEMHMRFLNAGGDVSVDDGVPLHGYRSRLNRTGGGGTATKTTEASKNDDDVDAYIANQACWHMLQAVKWGVDKEDARERTIVEALAMMRKTAFSVSWLEARARQRARGGGVGAVLTDLLWASDAMTASKQKKDSQALSRAIGLVRSAVAMSAQRLTKAPEMMAEYLWQRLVPYCRDGKNDDLKSDAGAPWLHQLILKDAERRRRGIGGFCGFHQPWMLPAGGTLLTTFGGQANSKKCSTVLRDLGDGYLDKVFGNVGAYVVTGGGHNQSGKGVIEIWNPAARTCVQTLESDAEVTSVTVLEDPSRRDRSSSSSHDKCRAFVVSGCRDGSIVIWNPRTGKRVRTLREHYGRVNSVTVLYDRSESGLLRCEFCDRGDGDACCAFVVSGSEDATIKIWNSLTGACVRTLSKSLSPVRSVAVCPVRESCASELESRSWRIVSGHSTKGSRASELAIWNPGSGSRLKKLKYDKSNVPNSPRSMKKHKDYYITCVVVLHDSSLSRELCGGSDSSTFIVTGDNYRSIRIWHSETLKCLKTLNGHAQHIESLALMKIRSTQIGALCGAAVRADENRCTTFVVSSSRDRTVKIWDPQSGKCVKTFEHRVPVSTVHVLQDGSENGRLRRLLGCRTANTDKKNERDALIVSCGDDACTHIWNPFAATSIVRSDGHSTRVNNVVALSSEDSGLSNLQFASCSTDNTIKIWNPLSSTCVRTLKGHSKQVFSVSMLHNCAGVAGNIEGSSAHIVSASSDAKVKIWNPLTGTCKMTLEEHADKVYSVTVLHDRSENGRLSRELCGALEDGARAGDDECRAFVVSGSRDETIKIWNPMTGACVRTLKGHSKGVVSVTVLYDRSTSGRLSRALCGAGEDGTVDDECRAFVVSGSADKRIKIWNPLTGKCVHMLKGHSARVNSVTVGYFSRALCGAGENIAGASGDGSYAFVVSGSTDKTIKIWNPLKGACVKTLKGHSGRVWSVTMLYDCSSSGRLSRALCGAGEDDGAGEDGCRAFVVSGSDDKTIKIWNPLKETCIRSYSFDSSVRSIAIKSNRMEYDAIATPSSATNSNEWAESRVSVSDDGTVLCVGLNSGAVVPLILLPPRLCQHAD